jgi:hypothetical protein
VARRLGQGTGIDVDDVAAQAHVVGQGLPGHRGEHLGSVYNFMVDKVTGQVAYAVLSFGGFLGFGGHERPQIVGARPP